VGLHVWQGPACAFAFAGTHAPPFAFFPPAACTDIHPYSCVCFGGGTTAAACNYCESFSTVVVVYGLN
jgi:hypothetical protein